MTKHRSAGLLCQTDKSSGAGDVAHHTGEHGLSQAIERQGVLAGSGEIDVERTRGKGIAFALQFPRAA